jgi:uncharacterized protein with PIN domain
MNIVDSSGWLEFFADGPNANDFSQPLSDTENLIVPSITVFEVFNVVLRERDEDAALMAASAMKQGKVIDLSFELAIQAAKTSTDYKIQCSLSRSILFSPKRIFCVMEKTSVEFRIFYSCPI